MEVLENGTKVLIFEDRYDKTNSYYSFGTIVDCYVSTAKYPPTVTAYLVEDSDGKKYRCEYGDLIMTPDDYKNFLFSKIWDNNDYIKQTIEENDELFGKIGLLEEDMVKNQSNQRVLKPNDKNNQS